MHSQANCETMVIHALGVGEALEQHRRLLLPGPSHQSKADGPQLLSTVGSSRGPKISESVKGKLKQLGIRIIQVGGMEKIFKRVFGITTQGERLAKASHCYLWTTAGPIAGLLFISTQKVAFCSDKAIKISSSTTGETVRIHYKVVIPLRKTKRVNQSANVKAPSEKYLEVVTADDFEFWFTGFLNSKRTFRCLQHVISQVLH